MPYKIDWFAIFIFLGIVQGVFLSVFFFSKENRKIPSNVFEGLMVLSMAGCTFEIFLCYTGYIQSCLWLVDYSEFMSFIIGPSFYLMMISLVKGRVERKHYLHYGAAAIWLLLQLPFLIQGEDVKWNAWIGAYHPPGLDFRPVELPSYFYNPPYHSEIILLHLTFYTPLVMVASSFFSSISRCSSVSEELLYFCWSVREACLKNPDCLITWKLII